MAESKRSLTNCASCSLKYDSSARVPRILPCTHTICQQCVLKSLEQPSDTVNCPVCNKLHVVTSGAETFPVNEDKLEIIKLSERKEERGQADINNAQIGGSCPNGDKKGTSDPPKGRNDDGKGASENCDDKHGKAKKIAKVAAVAGVGVVGAGAAVLAAPVVLGAAGFTAAGVAGGSLAATWMSVAGPIASGSLFAALQSAGAAGIGAAGTTLLAGTGGAAGAGIGAGIAKLVDKVKKKIDNNKNDDNNNPKTKLDNTDNKRSADGASLNGAKAKCDGAKDNNENYEGNNDGGKSDDAKNDADVGANKAAGDVKEGLVGKEIATKEKDEEEGFTDEVNDFHSIE